MSAMDRGSWRTWGPWWLGVAAATLLLFHRVVLRGQLLLERDMLRVYLPTQQFWASQLRQGRLPQWFPYDAFGQPLLGNAVLGPFHPYHLLALPFAPAVGLTWVAILCFPLAFGGAWMLLQRLGLPRAASGVAALLYAFSGYPLSVTNNLPYLLALATAPWALWAARGACADVRSPRALAALALLLALVLLAGDPMAYLVTAALALLLAVALPAPGVGRPAQLGVALAGVLLSALVAAVQLSCGLALARESIAGGSTLATAQLWSVSPARLYDLLLGGVWASPGQALDPAVSARLELGAPELWAESLYVGLPALLLAVGGALTARRSVLARLSLVLLGLGGVLMLGRHTPVFGWLYALVPPWRLLRYPEKLTPHVTLWLCVLAACGLVALEASSAARRRAVGLCAAALSLLALALGTHAADWLALVHGADGLAAPTREQLTAQLSSASLRSALACALLAGVVLAPLNPQRRTPLLALLLAVDLLAAARGVVGTAEPALLSLEPALVSAVRQREDGAPLGTTRVYSEMGALPLPEGDVDREELLAAGTCATLLPVTPALWGLEAAGGYLQGASPRVYRLLGDTSLRWRRGLALGSVGYAVMAKQRAVRNVKDNPALVATHDAFGAALLRNPGVLPRARFSAPRCVGSSDEAYARVSSPDFRPGLEAAVECDGQRLEERPRVEGSVRTLRYEPSDVELEVDARTPGVLVLADAWSSGWSATVDGRPARVLPADVAFRAVPLEAGVHRVRFTYRTPGLLLGASLSLLGLALCLLLTVAPALRRRPAPTSPPPGPGRSRTP